MIVSTGTGVEACTGTATARRSTGCGVTLGDVSADRAVQGACSGALGKEKKLPPLGDGGAVDRAVKGWAPAIGVKAPLGDDGAADWAVEGACSWAPASDQEGRGGCSEKDSWTGSGVYLNGACA